MCAGQFICVLVLLAPLFLSVVVCFLFFCYSCWGLSLARLVCMDVACFL